jgi:hypothetical protein
MPSEQRVGAIGTGASVPLEMCVHWMTDGWSHRQRCHRYPEFSVRLPFVVGFADHVTGGGGGLALTLSVAER